MKEKNLTRIAGILYVSGTIFGILSVAVLAPLLSKDINYKDLVSNENQLVIGSLFILAMGMVLSLVSIVLYPILRRVDRVLAVGFVVFRGGLEMVTYMILAASQLSLLEIVEIVGDSSTNTNELAHFLLDAEAIVSITSLVFLVGALMFYYLMFKSKLVPRWLSGWGLISLAPYLVATFLVVFKVIGHMSSMDTLLRIPLALQEMVLAVWLITKGFDLSGVKASQIIKAKLKK